MIPSIPPAHRALVAGARPRWRCESTVGKTERRGVPVARPRVPLGDYACGGPSGSARTPRPGADIALE